MANNGAYRVILAARLKKARKDSGLKAVDVAAAAGCTPNAVHSWETGASQPDGDTLSLLCRLYGVDFSYFNPAGANYSKAYLSPQERELLEAFRSCPETGKRFVLNTAKEICNEF